MELFNGGWETGLSIAAIVVGSIVFIASIGIFVCWIYYSWMRRENSMNYTGRDLTQKLFDNEGLNTTIKNSLFYAKFWNHNKRKDTYRLRPWTHNRRSIWTMMEASQQAYATIIREKKPSEFWIAFRLPRIIGFAGIIIGVALITWAIHAAGGFAEFNGGVGEWIKISIGISVVAVTMAYTTIWRAYVLRKNVPPMLEQTGLNEYEINAIKKIFTWALVYSIAQAILQSIKLAMQVMGESKSANNWG